MDSLNNTINIFLVRHCEPEKAGISNICLGRRDIPLSEKGKKEAKHLARYFIGQDIKHFYSSPLKRAMDTASVISNDVIISNNFYELDVGKWDGLSFDEIKKRYPEEYEKRGRDLENYVIEGGESMAMCKKRAMQELHNIIDKSLGDILIVTHLGVIRAIISSITKVSIESTFRYKIRYGSVSKIMYNKGNLSIVKIGDLDYNNKIDNG